MSNPIALKVEQGVPYIDRKKIMWLFSVIAPAGAALGPIAHKLVATSHCELPRLTHLTLLTVGLLWHVFGSLLAVCLV